MKVQLLFLFLLYSLLSVSECCSQVFEENLRKKGGFQTNKVDLKKNAKSVSCWTYYDVGHRLKFNLDVLQYNRDSESAFLSIHYDKDGTVNSYETKNHSRNTRGQLIDIHKEYQREYNSDGHLNRRVTFNADTLNSIDSLEYKYDDKDRIIEIKKTVFYSHNNSIHSSLEEVEYFEKGRKSTIYDIKDSVKTYRREYIYDQNDRLITEIGSHKNRNTHSRTEYFYSEKGLLEVKILFAFYPGLFIVEEFIGGWYYEYNYNEEGGLKRIASYGLEVEDENGETNYFKGELKSRSKYKEKKIGSNIVQIIKHKKGNRPYRITRRVILDHHRNEILEYKTSDRKCTLEIREITYY